MRPKNNTPEPKPKPAQRHQRALSLETLGDLAGGAARVMIDNALDTAVRDTEDRGDDGQKRSVTIVVEMKKFGDGDDGVVSSVTAKPTLPTYRTKPTIGRIQINNGKALMAFSPSAPGTPTRALCPGPLTTTRSTTTRPREATR